MRRTSFRRLWSAGTGASATFAGKLSSPPGCSASCTDAAIDALRSRKRWRAHAQAFAREDPEAPHQEVLAELGKSSARFEAREHLAFCFSCVGRSLEPEIAASILLREVFGYTNREAANICEVSESLFRHRLAAGRASMRETFQGLCGLVAKDGVCHQCSGLRAASPPSQRGRELPVLSDDPDQGWKERLEHVRDADLENGTSKVLHELMFRAVRDVERRAEGP